jgi:hypothetical protein
MRVALIALFVAGLALRTYAAFGTFGFAHPDEHQQYLEQAHRLAFGYGMQFWEQERGLRNLVYPSFLALILRSMVALGIDAPLVQAALLRWLLAVATWTALSLLAVKLHRQGRAAAALTLLAVAGLSPDMVYISVRLLSENAMMLPLCIGLLCMESWPGAAGLCWGLMFAIRFQSAFLIIPLIGVCCLDDLRDPCVTLRQFWRGRSVRMSLGCLTAVFMLVGVVDRLTLGGWFHSPIYYFHACIVEGQARRFGVDPWYRYLHWARILLWQTSVLCIPLLVIGSVRAWRYGIVALGFFAAHSMVAHKEIRFMWAALPVVLLCLAAGTECVWQWRVRLSWRVAVTALIAITFLVGFGTRSKKLDWNKDPFRSSALALAWVGRQSDLTGVALTGVGKENAGNYFYLHHNVPLLVLWHHEIARGFTEEALTKARVNYLIARKDGEPLSSLVQPAVEADFGELVVYHVQSQCVPGPTLTHACFSRR